MTEYTLNDEQQIAFDTISAWLRNREDHRWVMVLSGSAGTGKTYTLKPIIDSFRSRLVFTAPTNKATRVLRTTLASDAYRPHCVTTYSLLGLKLEPSGEVKELVTPEEEIDLSKYAAIVVDEGSMVNKQLLAHLLDAAETYDVKVLFLGDQAQLPPVGEGKSTIWQYEDQVTLTRVMRFDNQILKLATHLRGIVDHPAPRIRLENDNDGAEGVFALSKQGLYDTISRAAQDERDAWLQPDRSKAIAWRNVNVDGWNATIRMQLFGEHFTTKWLCDDRVIFTSPAKDLEGEPMASTDDEGTIIRISTSYHPLHGDFKIWNVDVRLDDNRLVTARVLHPESLLPWTQRKQELADAARIDGRRWKAFWGFVDDFHGLRHAYAITAHRSQGSTYETAYVDWRDILVNRTRHEAYRCLYVACSRPKSRLYLG